MPRIRTIKYEITEDEALGGCSHSARWLFVGLIAWSDDYGNQRGSAALLRGRVFPYDEGLMVPDVQKMLDELEGAGLVRQYATGEGEKCVHLVSWSKNQRVDKPGKPQVPGPPEGIRETPEKVPGTPGTEGKGREKDQETTPTSPNGDGSGQAKETSGDQASRTPAPARTVFDAWVEATGRDPARTKYTDKRRRLIRRALDDYSVEDLVDAVRGWRHSAHHRGENDRREVYNDIELLLRDAKQIEKFRDLERRSRNGSSRDAAAKRKRLEGVR